MALGWLTDAALATVADHGLLALFVFILLETAWVIHFVPSEVVIPAAAIHFVEGPASFAALVGLLTVGAVLGSLVAYYLFGVAGDRLLGRFDRWVPESEVERSKRWFRAYGEHSLAWMRLVPVLRTPISIPAGYARTPLGSFTLYSAAGWLVYNAALAGLVYSDGTHRSPAGAALAYAQSAPLVTSVVLGAVGLLMGAAWWRRDRLFARVSPGSR